MRPIWTLSGHRLLVGNQPFAFILGKNLAETETLIKELNEFETLRAQYEVTKHNYDALREECRAVEA